MVDFDRFVSFLIVAKQKRLKQVPACFKQAAPNFQLINFLVFLNRQAILGSAAHLSQQASTSFQTSLIVNSASTSGLYILHLFLWFGSAIMVGNRQVLVYKQAPTCFKTLVQNWCAPYFKADMCLFQNRQAPALKRRAHVSKQASAYFKQHISSRLILQTRIFKNQKMVPLEKVSASLKQVATCLQQVDICSNRRMRALNG